MSASARIGILGGSFDPVHAGHLHLARAARKALALDAVRFLLTPASPFKQDRALAPVEARVALLEKALAEEPAYAIDRTELNRPPPYYTFDTLSALSATLAQGSRLFFLIGADSLADLPKWHRAAELVSRFTLATVPRDPAQDLSRVFADLAVAFPARDVANLRAHVVRVAPLPISSTEVRRRLRAGEPVDGMVPAPVLDEIRRRGLYR